jgi:raffinose/stachyose/melibiose transport system permease protein
MRQVLGQRTAIISLLAPGFAFFVFAVLFPIILSVYYGMTGYQGIGVPEFIGLANFRQILLYDRVFWIALRNSMLLAVAYIVIQHPVCMFFAVIIDAIGGRVEKAFRTIAFLPVVISVVVTTKMWVSVLEPTYGLVNKALELLGLSVLKQQWLGDIRTSLASIILICIWQGAGWVILFYYAGLKGIREELYEAARIDGATGWQAFFRITLPLLSPVIRVIVTLAIISALKQMEVIFLTTLGGPNRATQFLGLYLYQRAFQYQQYGYGNAISVLFVTVCVVSNLVLNRLIRNRESS